MSLRSAALNQNIAVENLMTDWKKICLIDDIPKLGARVVQHVEGDIAIFRTADDEVFALHDRCPHKGGPLSQGIVYGKTVACPLHGWQIGLDCGTAVAPDEGCTKRFAVKVDDGHVLLNATALL
jgi:nitrite reductase (NADH) small subunit